jgi:AcrR family transcriptional regulator
MSRPLTRRESQERTRSRLIQAAERVFLKKGFLAASIGQIARTAGYTTGAVYSNFASKEDLGLAVIQQRMLAGVTSLQEELADASPTVASRLAALERWGHRELGNEAWVVLVTEFVLTARHKAPMRNRFSQGLHSARAVIAEILEGQSQDLGVDQPMDSERLAAAVLGLGMGLSVLRVADPTLDPSTFADATGLLLAQLSSGVAADA